MTEYFFDRPFIGSIGVVCFFGIDISPERKRSGGLLLQYRYDIAVRYEAYVRVIIGRIFG